jgi:hypothetical protein
MATRDGGSGVEIPEKVWSSCRSFGRLSGNFGPTKKATKGSPWRP